MQRFGLRESFEQFVERTFSKIAADVCDCHPPNVEPKRYVEPWHHAAFCTLSGAYRTWSGYVTNLWPDRIVHTGPLDRDES